MITALFVAGIISIVGGVAAGILTGSFVGIVISLISGLIMACLLFGMANILQNQEEIFNKLQGLKEFNRKVIGKKSCEKCENKYDEDLTSCPNCGYKSTAAQ